MSQVAGQDGRDIEDWLRAEQSSCGTSRNSEVLTKTHDIENGITEAKG
jgi:hypothetical protein